MLVPVLVPTIPSAVLVLALMWLVPVNGYPQILAIATICTLVYWAGFAVMSGKDERRRWLSTSPASDRFASATARRAATRRS